MSDTWDRSTKISSLKETVLRKLCEVLDKSSIRGWRKLGEIVNNDRRFEVSSDHMEMCSLRVLEVGGSPSLMLLRLMGDRGCTVAHLSDYLQTLGNMEALQCLKPQDLQILLQPHSVALLCGHNLRLSCLAVGKSTVQYQWFKSREEVPGGNSPDLLISSAQLKDAGFYICRVNSEDACEFSQWAQVDVLNVGVSYGQTYHSLDGRLKLAIQPQSQRLHAGESLQLECGAVGRPIPRYQWHRNSVPLPNATKRKLSVTFHLLLRRAESLGCSLTAGVVPDP
ncbi:Mucosa-associated lymphoid tissue lymphoma translocation-like protein 1 [Oryzias melastigma]|uniref:Mucosa-associated lymphoid tissue lymphoma translocation-like protein 1 n=1 Tax=Oryzias melastigma TaxID=30732 RepID=A0A834CHE5_ORYME|nr:Mucosa-associated lymphoid tissue lymphoma translocation-like protein 1 [Oryzias melastigma]